MDGDAICNDDYIFSEDGRPAFHCSVIGTWTSNAGECRQRIWKNPREDKPMLVPRTSVPGWTVCINGTSPNLGRFYFNFKRGNNDIVLTASIRALEDNVIKFNSKEVGKAWIGGDSYTLNPFPIEGNKPFLMKFKAISLDDIQLSVDGTLYINHSLPWSFDTVKVVSLGGDVDVQVIDLWCDA
ncbi:uncharacterized protein [Littorina saxatilis]|uniref:uncharacterized protein n=1 Tax=Littorina saxatilis TaxID=31220 RepID=UPI0038B4B090